MSVTAAQGFAAAGVSAGLRSSGAPDLALVVNRGPSTAAAAVFTSNRSKANPILWSERVMAEVLVCSTGLIGQLLDRQKVIGGVADALAVLDAPGDNVTGGFDAATAILTTDTVAKLAVHAGDGWTIGGMAKGAGMLAPALATMLAVITTDADLDGTGLDAALTEAVRTTFNRLDSDGGVRGSRPATYGRCRGR